MSESDSSKEIPPIPQRIGNWWLGRNLGSGYSGSIFEATHVHSRQVVALKVQHVGHECPTNRYERHLYPLLQGGLGMPTLWDSGVFGCWDYLAIDLLGASLDNINRKMGGPIQALDLGSVCCIAMQMIARLETMHARGVLHRDIQLGNTVVGPSPHEKTLYMIDFGFSKRYIDPHTRRHIPDSKAKRDFIGNYWFSSVNVHCRGKVPSRRDDLEAAALMFIHLLTPRGLAWTRNGVPKTDDAHERLKQQKRRATPESLCRNIPVEFEEFLRYCRSLKFAEQPDYERWIEEFRELKIEYGYGDSDDFVWPPPKPQVLPAEVAAMSPRRIRTPGVVEPQAMAGILNGLTNLNLAEDRKILGDRKNVEDAVRSAQADLQLDSAVTKITEVIELSSDSGNGDRNVTPKAQRLIQLARRTSNAIDNAALSKLVWEFIDVMKSNSGRTLTKEGSAFLDALYKQLADPSVFVTPMRRRSNIQKPEEMEPGHVKLGVVARLKREVATARSNKVIAEMVAEFGTATNKSLGGRTITKASRNRGYRTAANFRLT